MRPTLVFDYDGTIHNTMRIYEPAFRETYAWLVENRYCEEQPISSEQIAGWLGLNSKEMWNSFLPQLPQEVKDEASHRVCSSMVEQIKTHKAVWYSGAKEVLNELYEAGYQMLILSNCKISYRKSHWKEFAMKKLFSAFYDCESYDFAPKTEIIHNVQNQFPGPYIVIGDRYSDLECARACDSLFVGCKYGFGKENELEEADYLIDAIKQLPEIIDLTR